MGVLAAPWVPWHQPVPTLPPASTWLEQPRGLHRSHQWLAGSPGNAIIMVTLGMLTALRGVTEVIEGQWITDLPPNYARGAALAGIPIACGDCC